MKKAEGFFKIKKAVKTALCIAEALIIFGVTAACAADDNGKNILNEPGTDKKAQSSDISGTNKQDGNSPKESQQNTESASKTSNENISLEEAKKAALSDAKVKESDVVYTKEKLDFEDGIKVYEIEFHTAAYEYEYEINAITGEIYSKEGEIRGHGSIGQGGNGAAGEAYIGEEKAKEKAISHAGLSASGVKFTEVKLDYDDGIKVYEIEFYSEGREYEYEINALSGEIVKHKMD